MELYSWASIEELIYADIIYFGLFWMGEWLHPKESLSK